MFRFVLLSSLAVLLLASSAGLAEVYLYDLQWGTPGTGDYQFDHPRGICVSGDEVFVADYDNARIMVYTLDGVFLRKSAPGLSLPMDCSVDDVGNVFVCRSAGGQYIAKLTGDLTAMLATWADGGSAEGQMSGPDGLCVDSSRNRVYVADTFNDRISVWTRTGGFVKTIGESGDADGQFHHPSDVALDSLGRLYVVDVNNNRLQRFAASGTWAATIMSGDVGATASPRAVAVGPADRVYAVFGSTASNDVLKLTAAGTVLSRFGSIGSGEGQIGSSAGIAVDAAERVYVADWSNCRVTRFRKNHPPPTPSNVHVLPTFPRDNNVLDVGLAMVGDLDLGDTVTCRYMWQKSNDGINWSPAGKTRKVSSALTSVGQRWKVSVRSYDGHELSPWVTSPVVTIRVAKALATLTAQAEQSRAGNLAVTVTASCAGDLSGRLCNLAGREVALLAARALPAGTSRLTMPATSSSGTRLPAGTYLLTLTLADDGGQQARHAVPVRVD